MVRYGAMDLLADLPLGLLALGSRSGLSSRMIAYGKSGRSAARILVAEDVEVTSLTMDPARR